MCCFLGSRDFVSHKYLTLESLCNHESDHSGNVEEGIVLRSKTTTLHLHHTFEVYFRGTQRQFSEYICSEDDLRSRIFGTFLVTFLACLLPLRFSNI